jgi:hypothetical protein
VTFDRFPEKDEAGLREGSKQIVVLTTGTYDIVKSNRISIQGRYENTVMTEVIVGGDLLHGNQLELKLLTETEAGVTWNGRAILQEPGNKISLGSGLVLVTKQGDPLQNWGRLSNVDFMKWNYRERVETFRRRKLVETFEVTLPLGIGLTMNTIREEAGYKFKVDLLINMYPELAGQSGHCGKFNGNPHDDALPHLKIVSGEPSLLGSPSSMTESSPPPSTAELANGSECTSEAYTNATAMCTALCGGDTGGQAFAEACVFDMCRGGGREDVLVSDCLMSWQARTAVVSASSSYVEVYPDSFCHDDGAILADNRWEEGYTTAPLKYESRLTCEALCDESAKCQFIVWGWNPIESYYRCATFESCATRSAYHDGDPSVFQKSQNI